MQVQKLCARIVQHIKTFERSSYGIAIGLFFFRCKDFKSVLDVEVKRFAMQLYNAMELRVRLIATSQYM